MNKFIVTAISIIQILTINCFSDNYNKNVWENFFKTYGQGTPLINKDLSKSFNPRHVSNGKIEVTKTDSGYDQCLKFTVTKRPKRSYMVQSVALLEKPVAQNSVLVASFFARTISTVDESGYGTISYYIGGASKPWKSYARWEDSIDTEWKEYHLPVFIADKKKPAVFEPGSLRFTINAGYTPQVIEVADIRIRNYATEVKPENLPKLQVTYEGREPDAPWRKEAEARIEKYRKGDLKIIVKDEKGNVIPDARVNIKMKKHAFPFGAAFNTKWYHENKDSKNGQKYLQTYKDNFTRISHIGILKWPHFIKNRKLALENVDFLRKEGFEVRGHCLIWPRWDRLPYDGDKKFIIKMENDHAAWKKLLTDHIRDEAGALKGKVVDWDVYNEPYSHSYFPDKLGDQVILDWYNITREVEPDATLYINEGGHLSRSDLNTPMTQNYIRLIEYLQKNKAPLGGIGFESHFGWRVPHPQKVYDFIDSFAKYNLPIGITEFDQIVSDEKLQADWERDFLTITFSHPAVSQFIRWGVWNGISQRGFINKNWSLKPNGKEWKKLVFKKWWTKEGGYTDQNGTYSTRGFLGEYEIKVSLKKNKKIVNCTLTNEGKTLTISL